MQTDLRLLLLIIGFVLGGYIIYLAYRNRQFKAQIRTRENFEKTVLENTHQRKKGRSELHMGEADPLLEDYAAKDILEGTVAEEKKKSEQNISSFSAAYDPAINEPEEVPSPLVEKSSLNEFVVLSILPKEGAFAGHILLSALRANQFHYGKLKIFHRYHNDNPTQAVMLSLASLVEPGIFDRHHMASENFPGIVLWMEATKTPQDAIIFEKLLTSAKQLAVALNGILCDGHRHPLTVQTITHYRLKIRNLQSLSSSKTEAL